MSKSRVQGRSLKANFIYSFISQILTLIVPLITTPYLSRVLHETGNGQYSFSVSIITYFILFANLGFDVYGQRQIAAHREDKEKKSAIFWEIFIFKCILTLISLGVLYAVVFSGVFGEVYTKLILILSIQVIAVPFDIQFLFRGDEDFRAIALRTIIMRAISLVCIFAFVKNETQTPLYALLLSLSVIASNIVMWPSLIKAICAVPLKELKLLRHVRPAILIFLPTLAVTVFSVFDKTMIGLLAQNADYENGCYEQAYKINSISLLLVTIISPVMVSRNAHDFHEGNLEQVKHHLYSASRYVWMMGLPLIVGFYVLGKNLCDWFLGPGYQVVPLLLVIMSVRFISSGFSEIFGSQLFIAIGKEHYPLIATTTAAIVNVTLNYFLIPDYGATGAAIATAVCEIVVALVYLFPVAKGKYVNLGRVLLLGWKYLVAAAIMFVPIFFMQRYMNYSILSFLVIMFTGMAVYALSLFLLRDKFFLSQTGNVLGAVRRKLLKRGNDKTQESATEIQTEETKAEEDTDV